MNKVKLIAALAVIQRNLEGIPLLGKVAHESVLASADAAIDRAIAKLKDLTFEIEEETE